MQVGGWSVYILRSRQIHCMLHIASGQSLWTDLSRQFFFLKSLRFAMETMGVKGSTFVVPVSGDPKICFRRQL